MSTKIVIFGIFQKLNLLMQSQKSGMMDTIPEYPSSLHSSAGTEEFDMLLEGVFEGMRRQKQRCSETTSRKLPILTQPLVVNTFGLCVHFNRFYCKNWDLPSPLRPSRSKFPPPILQIRNHKILLFSEIME